MQSDNFVARWLRKLRKRDTGRCKRCDFLFRNHDMRLFVDAAAPSSKIWWVRCPNNSITGPTKDRWIQLREVL